MSKFIRLMIVLSILVLAGIACDNDNSTPTLFELCGQGCVACYEHGKDVFRGGTEIHADCVIDAESLERCNTDCEVRKEALEACEDTCIACYTEGDTTFDERCEISTEYLNQCFIFCSLYAGGD